MRTTKDTHKLKMLNSLFNDETRKDFMETYFIKPAHIEYNSIWEGTKSEDSENEIDAEFIGENSNQEVIFKTVVNGNIKYVEINATQSIDNGTERFETREQCSVNISSDETIEDERYRSVSVGHIRNDVVRESHDNLAQKINRRNIENCVNYDQTVRHTRIAAVQHVDVQLVHQDGEVIAKRSENWLCGKSVSVIDEDGNTISKGVVQKLSDYVIITTDGHLIIRGKPFKIELMEGTDLSLENIVVGQDPEGRIILDMVAPETRQQNTPNTVT